MITLCSDVGGTTTRFGLSSNKESFDAIKRVPTTTPNEYREHLKLFLEEESEKEAPAIICGVAGVTKQTTVERAPNLSSWEGVDIGNLLSDLSPVCQVENDAHLAALGEATRGAGRDASIVAYLSVGTGVGGGRVVDGMIDRHTTGMEPGKMIIDRSSFLQLEDAVSGMSISRRGLDPRNIHEDAFWDEYARMLAVGVHNLIMVWSPDVVVLGGGMVLKSPGIAVDRVAGYVASFPSTFPSLPPIKPSELGDDAVLFGGLAYNTRSTVN